MGALRSREELGNIFSEFDHNLELVSSSLVKGHTCKALFLLFFVSRLLITRKRTRTRNEPHYSATLYTLTLSRLYLVYASILIVVSMTFFIMTIRTKWCGTWSSHVNVCMVHRNRTWELVLQLKLVSKLATYSHKIKNVNVAWDSQLIDTVTPSRSTTPTNFRQCDWLILTRDSNEHYFAIAGQF